MPSEISHYLVDIDDEFREVDLGDKRRNDRLREIASRVVAAPTESFPRLMASVAEREALYRLLNNDAVGWEAIVEPHTAAAVARGRDQGLTRVVHDTTDFVFSGDREGMGTVMQDTKGFFGHFALAVSGGEDRIPLGVVGLIPWVRPTAKRTQSLNARKMVARKAPRAQKESCRWETLATQVSQQFGTSDVIHVMDQEADDFVLITELQRARLRFVVRGSSDRLLERRGDSIDDVLATRSAEAFRTVPLSSRAAPRSEKHRRAHPPRQEREARLDIRWAEVEITKPQHAQTDSKSASVFVVQVLEPDPPSGEAPVRWTLLTSEPVHNIETATAVVDHYRARWRIEEYFRALKQGCALQKRQIESYEAMLCALAIFVPVAWRLLLLRSLGRHETKLAAEAIFDEDELAAVRVLCEHKRCFKFPKTPTMRDVMLAIAAIGGHIRNNGDPGWIVLGRGFEDVLKAAVVWRAARSEM